MLHIETTQTKYDRLLAAIANHFKTQDYEVLIGKPDSYAADLYSPETKELFYAYVDYIKEETG